MDKVNGYEFRRDYSITVCAYHQRAVKLGLDKRNIQIPKKQTTARMANVGQNESSR